jgi:hypothetical protein
MKGNNKAFSAIKSGALNSLNHGNSIHTDLSRMESSHESIKMATKYGLIKKQLGAMLDPHDYHRKMPTVPREHYLSIAKRPIPFKGKVPGEVDPVKFQQFFKEKYFKNHKSQDNIGLSPAAGTYGNLRLPSKNPRPVSNLPPRRFSGVCNGVTLG